MGENLYICSKIAQMDFLQLVNQRQSDRGYKDKPVDKEVILRCLEAARLAPSACNAQPWHFIVITDAELKNQLADCTSSRVLGMNHFTKQAPVHIAVVEEGANFTSSAGSLIKKRHFPLTDIGIAVEHFCLQAASEGLGTCILGWFDEKKVKKLLQVPGKKRIQLIITLGYSAQETREKRRKPLEQIHSFNAYGQQ